MAIVEGSSGFWYDGKFESGDRITLSIQDPGLLYGATLFTTLRVFDNNLDHPKTHWSAHLDRLKQSVKQLPAIWQEPNWEKIRRGGECLSSAFPILRITLFPNGREWITGRQLPIDLPQRQTQGIQAQLLSADYARSFPQWKTGNYLAPWLGLQTAIGAGNLEAILTDAAGNWLETSTGNLWGYRSGVWFTPVLENILPGNILPGNILPGIQRSHLIHALQSAQIPVEETHWSPEFVQSLDAMGYCNCVVGVVPIRSVIHEREIVWEAASEQWSLARQLHQLLE